MDSDVADAMNWMLQRVVSGGTGIAAKLDDRAVAGKTGTSEGARDLWFIGSVPQLTTAVWFGYDDNRETKSGSGEAAWAWKQFMLQLVDELPPRPFPPKPKLKRPFQPPSKEAKRDSKLPFKGFEYAPGPSTQARRSPRSQPILGTGVAAGTGCSSSAGTGPLRLSPLGSPRPLPRPWTRSMHAETGCGHGFNQARIQAF